MKRWTQDDGGYIQDSGSPFIKVPSTVYMFQLEDVAEVETNEGTLTANPGDWVCYDPKSGHIWPVADGYKSMYYVTAHWHENDA